MSLCCVWYSLLLVCAFEFVLCLVQIGACLEKESVCCVCYSVQRVWGIDFLLCVREFGAGVGE